MKFSSLIGNTIFFFLPLVAVVILSSAIAWNLISRRYKQNKGRHNCFIQFECIALTTLEKIKKLLTPQTCYSFFYKDLLNLSSKS